MLVCEKSAITLFSDTTDVFSFKGWCDMVVMISSWGLKTGDKSENVHL